MQLSTCKLAALLAPALMLASACSPGHFAGGGRLQPCAINGNCGLATAQGAGLLPFSFDLNALDVNKSGRIDAGDRFIGHFNLNFPKGSGAPASISKIHAKVLFGGVCGFGDGSDCFPNSVANLGASPLAARAGYLAGAAPLRDFIRLHPGIGFGFFFGFYRLSGKNPDTCDEPDGDCRLILVQAFDMDSIAGPSNGDLLFVVGESGLEFAGNVVNGNLRITSEIVPAP